MPMIPLSTHATQTYILSINNRLETDSSILAKWFSENYMELNEEKCHFMIFGNKIKGSVVAIEVRYISSRYGTVTVRLRYGYCTVTVRLRYGYGTKVKLKKQCVIYVRAVFSKLPDIKGRTNSEGEMLPKCCKASLQIIVCYFGSARRLKDPAIVPESLFCYSSYISFYTLL